MSPFKRLLRGLGAVLPGGRRPATREDLRKVLGVLDDRARLLDGDAADTAENAHARMCRAEKRLARVAHEVRRRREKGEGVDGARLRKLGDEAEHANRERDASDAEMAAAYQIRALCSLVMSLATQVREILPTVDFDAALMAHTTRLRLTLDDEKAGRLPLEVLRGFHEDLTLMARELRIEVEEWERVRADALEESRRKREAVLLSILGEGREASGGRR